MTVRAVSWACGHFNEMLLIQKKKFLPNYSVASLTYDRQKKCPTILYGVNLWLKPVYSTGAIFAATVVGADDTVHQTCGVDPTLI